VEDAGALVGFGGIFISKKLAALPALLFISGMTGGVSALDYPTRNITMVVPFSPGGGADLGSKVVAEKISPFLGKPLISEYKPGAGGGLGAALVAKAKPDGYTFVVGSQTTLMINPMTKKDLAYKFDDFIQVSGYSMIPISLNARGGGPWKTLAEFIADAKKNPGKFRYGTYGASARLTLRWNSCPRKPGSNSSIFPFPGARRPIRPCSAAMRNSPAQPGPAACIRPEA
jgi:tripartite-type tricarboxylate transporter receptor subunit TctC